MFELSKMIDLKSQHMVFQLINSNGTVAFESEASHNLVLNNAYELIATNKISSLFDYACVGTGSTVPSVGQTGLVNEVSRVNSLPSGFLNSTTRVANGEYEFLRVRQFAAVAGQNLTEWGYSPNAGVGNNLSVRELFRDGLNAPISVPVLAGQQLRLIYKARFIIDVAPVAGSITIAGVGTRTGVLHKIGHQTGAVTFANADLQTFEALSRGSELRAGVLVGARPSTAYGAAIVIPSASAPVAAVAAYAANSRTREIVPLVFDVNSSNGTIVGFWLSGGDQAVVNALNYCHAGLIFVLNVGQEFVKTNNDSFTMPNWSVSW